MKVPNDPFWSGFRYDGVEHDRPAPAQVVVCKDWLRVHAGVWRTFTYGSYQLKHDVERYYPDFGGINNGAFIQAAIELGYEWKRDVEGGPNAIFKLTYSSFIQRCRAPQGEGEDCVCGPFNGNDGKHNKQRAYFRSFNTFTPAHALELSRNAGRLAKVGEALPPDHYRFGREAVLQPMSDMSKEFHP